MKKTLFLILGLVLAGIFTVNAQTTIKKDTLDVSNIMLCQMHINDITKDIKGLESFELSQCGKYAFVSYDSKATNPDKILSDLTTAAEEHAKVCKMDMKDDKMDKNKMDHKDKNCNHKCH